MDQQHMVIVKPLAEWARQATDALAAIRLANHGKDPARLRDAYDADPAAFGLLVEALAAMGAEVDDEMRALARLRPVDEAIT